MKKNFTILLIAKKKIGVPLSPIIICLLMLLVTSNRALSQGSSGCFNDVTTANFSLGTVTNTYIGKSADGELVLKPVLTAEFDVLPLATEWNSFPWTGGESTVSGGELIVEGARFNTEPETTVYGPGSSLEFVATFGGATFQIIGFGGGTNATDVDGIYNGEKAWAMFSTNESTTKLFAKFRNDENGDIDVTIDLGENYIGTPHLYRITWLTDGRFEFYIDGILVHAEDNFITTGMRPAISDFANDGIPVTVKWIRLAPYTSTGTFESRIYDASSSSFWGNITWTADVPAGTALTISVRTGNTATPDGSWSAYTPIASSGTAVNTASRYIQYKAELSTTDAALTPVLNDVGISCSAAGPLPVQLVNLKAGVMGKDIQLTWTTQTEINNRGFEIQRSADGASWTTIAFVSGAGNSVAVRNYSYIDKNPGPNNYYYRLRQVDADGRFKYSPVVSAGLNEKTQYVLAQNYPNPSRGETNIQFSIPEAGSVKLSLIDVNGRRIKILFDGARGKGTHSVQFNPKGLSAGIYYYKMEAGSFQAIKKMIIQ